MNGSLYFGVRYKNSEHRIPGKVIPVDGKISINMNTETLLQKLDASRIKDRFSFHGSGEIHDGQIGHTTYREPLISTKEQSELFWIYFKELNYFEEIQQLRKGDISLMMSIKEKHMLILHTLITPRNNVQLQPINNGKNNMFVLIDFHGIKEIGDITLQLVFAPRINPEAPQSSIVIWSTKDSKNI